MKNVHCKNIVRKGEGMTRFAKKYLVLSVVTCFFFYSITGCGSSTAVVHPLDKYNEKPYSDEATFYANKDDAYKATVLALQQSGYVITLSDAQTGLINGEKSGSSILPEEHKQISKDSANDVGAGEILIGILGILLIVGLIAMLTSDSNNETQSNSNTTTSTTTTTVVSSSHEKITSYKYIVTVNTTALTDSTSQLQLSAVRQVIENGSVTNSSKFENKYLNYGIFDAVQAQLNGVREKID
ncbi:MAG: hypothetical protein HY960_06450 [Ignavibacteriae bacterium]|nr:hypothetical protein [Ignavibacteriota bacterium]